MRSELVPHESFRLSTDGFSALLSVDLADGLDLASFA